MPPARHATAVEDDEMAGGIHIEPKTDDASAPKGQLAHLRDLKDWKIADGEPDIRGWLVILPDGQLAGRVEDLVVDTDDMAVRYLELKVLHEVAGTEDDTYLLVPVSAARLDEEDPVVIVDRLPTPGITRAPAFGRGVPTREQERAIREFYGPAGQAPDAPERREADQRRFWGSRRAGRANRPYVGRGASSTAPVEAVVIETVVVDGVVVAPSGSGTRGVKGPATPLDEGEARR
jgi:hypothetical protein